MGKFVEGDVVVVPFPFSDLSGSKRRPAVILKNLPGDDAVMCAVTKVEPHGDDPYVILIQASFQDGGLTLNPSYARTSKLFTADKNIVIKKVGTLTNEVMEELRCKASGLF